MGCAAADICHSVSSGLVVIGEGVGLPVSNGKVLLGIGGVPPTVVKWVEYWSQNSEAQP